MMTDAGTIVRKLAELAQAEPVNHFAVLGLPRGVGADEIEAQYRIRVASLYDADGTVPLAGARKLRKARDVLSTNEQCKLHTAELDAYDDQCRRTFETAAASTEREYGEPQPVPPIFSFIEAAASIPAPKMEASAIEAPEVESWLRAAFRSRVGHLSKQVFSRASRVFVKRFRIG